MDSTRAVDFLPRAWSSSCVWILLLGVPLTAAVPHQVTPYKAEGRCQNNSTEYYSEDSGVCCARCPPGKSQSERCNVETDTVCRPCGHGTYTECWNYIAKCRPCRDCDSGLGFEIDTPCSLTQNTRCRCKTGMHCQTWTTQNTSCRCKTGMHCQTWTDCNFCKENAKCPPGKEVTNPGNRTSDTQCAPCPDGSYQSKTSLEAQCRRHTDCVAQGLRVMTPGTATSDSQCSEIATTESSTAQISTAQRSTTHPETKHQEWGYMNLIFTLLVLAVLSIIFIFMFLLVQKPGVCKKIGLFLRHGHQRAESHHLDSSERQTVKKPFLEHGKQSDPVDEITHSQIRSPVTCLEVETENLQQESHALPLLSHGRGPYEQESETPSPPYESCSVGPQGPVPRENLSASHQGSPINEQTQGTTQQEEGVGDIPQISAGDSGGVMMVADTLTYTGNIYIFHNPMVIPQVTPEGSARPMQATPDPHDSPTSIPEQGPLELLRFHQGAAWHCVSPQQEEGKDMHLTTEESMTGNVWPWGMDSNGHLYGRPEQEWSLCTPLAEQLY